MKGGHARSGPSRNPDALRRSRDKVGDWIHLRGPREGAPPAWPLPRSSARELALWAGEWRRPEATEWERAGQEHEVAIYIRTMVAAEKPKAPAALLRELRAQREALGLTPAGRARNHWIVEDGAANDDRSAVGEDTEAEQPAGETDSVRDRWKLIEGGAAASG